MYERFSQTMEMNNRFRVGDENDEEKKYFEMIV